MEASVLEVATAKLAIGEVEDVPTDVMDVISCGASALASLQLLLVRKPNMLKKGRT